MYVDYFHPLYTILSKVCGYLTLTPSNMWNFHKFLTQGLSRTEVPKLIQYQGPV